MITKFEIYEDWSSWKKYLIPEKKPKKGDYVLLEIPTSRYLKDFMDNNIGQIIKKNGNKYTVKFDKKLNDVQFEILKKDLEFKIQAHSTTEYRDRMVVFDAMKQLKKLKDYTDEAEIDVVETDIKHYSKNKEELESILAQTKYNL
jgi:CII-binding regulator of phage lambda lysogenization HflD